LHNVSAQTPSNGSILQYVSSTQLWTAVAGTTTNIAEGTNLYYLDSRARAAISLTTVGSSGAATYNSTTGVLNIPNYSESTFGTVTSVGLSAPTGFSVSGSPVTTSGTLALSFAVGYSLPTTASQSNWDTAYTNRITSATSPLSIASNVISISQATTSTNGYLSSTDWNTFNNKQSALTNPVTGTGTTNYLPKFTGTSTIGNSGVYDNGNGIAFNGTNISYAATNRGNITINGTSGIIGFNNSGTAMGYFFHDGTNMQMWNELSGSLIFGNSATTRMTLNASGNLGLGVTPSAWNTLNALQVGYASLGAFTTEMHLSANSYYSSGWKYITTGFGARYSMNDAAGGAHAWYTAPSGTAGNAISFTQAMTLDASGNLGLGTTSPSGYGSGYPTMDLRGSVGSGIKIGNATDVALLYANSTATYLRTSSSKDLILGTFDTARLTIASTGAATFSSSVTAGGTITLNAPASNYATLNLNGAAGYGAELKFGEATGGYLAAIRHNYNVGTGLEFYTGGIAGGNLRMYIAPSGNVGIGTSTPDRKLSINGDTSLLGNNYISTSKFFQWEGGAYWTTRVTSSGNQFEIYRGDTATSAFVVSSGNNVLIGTTTDAGYKLDVNGYARVQGSGLSTIFTGNDIQFTRAGTAYITATGSGSSLNFGTNNTNSVFVLASTGAAAFSSSVTATQYNSTVSSGANIILNKGTGPAIRFSKTDATAQSWSINADPNFRFYDETAAIFPLILTAGTGAATFSSTIKTGATSYGAGAVKFGIRNAGSATGAGGYMAIEIDGTTYFLNLFTSTP
jgi:hypothetical protein